MSQIKRHEAILNVVKKKGFATITELASSCKVTPQTIRRDLKQLDSEGILNRYHGGAGLGQATENTPYQTRKSQNQNIKEKIAKTVAGMIPDGASLFLNIGTTTELIAKHLINHKNLLVVTNNIHVATILSAKEDFSVIVAGGEVRYRDGGIIGEATCDFINQFRMDFGIIGISGISSDGALLDFDFREVKVSQAILGHSQHVILAADHTKFERKALVEQGHISQVDYLVSDAPPPPSIRDILKEHQIQFIESGVS